MNYNLTTLNSIEQARGVVVVIDVFRAFSTACYIQAAGAKRIIVLNSVEKALAYKESNPEYVIIGERNGVKVKGFHYNNSPVQIQMADLKGKTVVLTTSLGTQGIIHARNAEEVLTGSFVNSRAIVSFIQKKKPETVSFLCTDDSSYNNEDYQCAAYIRSHLEGNPVPFSAIKQFLQEHPCSDRFLRTHSSPDLPKDFELCMQDGIFPFVLKAKREETGEVMLIQDTGYLGGSPDEGKGGV